MSHSLITHGSPHIQSRSTTRKIMFRVIVAMLPILCVSVLVFGFGSLMVVGLCTAFCVLWEVLFCVAAKKPLYTDDLSAVVTGMLLGFSVPVTVSWYACLVGSAAAIVIAKQLFGGIGQNFVNPSLFGRAVMLASFPAQMTDWSAGESLVGLTSSATPLAQVTEGSLASLPSLRDLFLGLRCGCIGETCVLAIVIGGVYMMITRVISPLVPVCFLGSAFLLTAWLSPAPLVEFLSGGLFLSAFFMATDYTTSPISAWGKVIFGVGCGVLTVVLRHFAAVPEGVSYAVLFMNILVPYINRFTRKRPFGTGKKAYA